MSLNSHFYFFWGNVVNLNKTCWSGSLTTWRKIDEDKISCQNKWLLKNKSVPNFKCSIKCNGHRDVGEHIMAEKLNTLVKLFLLPLFLFHAILLFLLLQILLKFHSFFKRYQYILDMTYHVLVKNFWICILYVYAL